MSIFKLKSNQQPLYNRILFDGVALAADETAPGIERDAEGVPTAWRLLSIGVNDFTRSGEKLPVGVTADDINEMIDYFNEKGVKIPLDSNHFLKRFADENKCDETEVLALVPRGKLAMGYGKLQGRSDGIWLTAVEFNPLAREMMKQKTFLYYSPVIRGLRDGRLRITSIALENEPCINNQDSLAASADLRDDPDVSKQTSKENKHMKTLCAALGVLLGMDSLALSADGEAPEGVVKQIENLNKEVTGLRKFENGLRDGLALSADDDLNKIQGHVLGLKAKASNADSLAARVNTLELSAEDGKKEKLIESGLASGKLVNSMLDWAKGLDSVALSAYLENAPAVIPLDKIDRHGLSKDDSIALSAEDRQVCRDTGISEEDFLAEKKAQTSK